MARLKKHYLVIACTNCKRLLLGTSDKKSRTCPYCGVRVKMENAQVIFESENSKEARVALRDAKTRLKSSVSADSE